MKYDSPEFPIHHVIDNNPYMKQITAVNKMADTLRSWNLKYDEFPDYKTWLLNNWIAPYGKEEALEYLYESAKRRRDSYWGIQSQTFNSKQDSHSIASKHWYDVSKKLENDFSRRRLLNKQIDLTAPIKNPRKRKVVKRKKKISKRK